MVPHGIGDYVKYADHLAAVAEAEQRERDEAVIAQSTFDLIYAEGQRAAISEAIAAVEVIHRHYDNGLTGGSCANCGGPWPCPTIAAIKAVGGE
jgi:hypothetical protein